MKTADIQLHGEYMATNIDGRASGRVRVVEKSIPRRHGFGGSTRKDGVRVEVVKALPTRWGSDIEAGTTTVISTRDVKRPWVDKDDEREAAREAARERAEEIADRFSSRGYGVGVDRSAGAAEASVSSVSKTVTLSFDAAERLLGMTEEAEV